MNTFLMTASVALMGVIAGIYATGPIHDRRIVDLSASQYLAMHQMRDKTFRQVMPVIGLTMIALLIATTIFAVAPGLPRWLAIAASVLVIADAAFTDRRQLPLNRQIQGWTEATIPANWTRTRDRWAANHNLRVLLGLSAYGCLLAAVLLTLSAG